MPTEPSCPDVALNLCDALPASQANSPLFASQPYILPRPTENTAKSAGSPKSQAHSSPKTHLPAP